MVSLLLSKLTHTIYEIESSAKIEKPFPFELAPRFLIFDRDAKVGREVSVAVRSLKMSPVRMSFESPWQNGVAERWVESCQRDLLDHVIVVNERHLKRSLVTIGRLIRTNISPILNIGAPHEPRSSPNENLRAPQTLDRVQALFSIRGTT